MWSEQDLCLNSHVYKIVCVQLMMWSALDHCVCLFKVRMYLYSGTSLNGPSEMRTASVKWIAQKAPFDFSMYLVHF